MQRVYPHQFIDTAIHIMYVYDCTTYPIHLYSIYTMQSVFAQPTKRKPLLHYKIKHHQLCTDFMVVPAEFSNCDTLDSYDCIDYE